MVNREETASVVLSQGLSQGPCLVSFREITVESLTANLEYQMKSNDKTTSTTPRVNRETNLMRTLNARLEDGTVASM